MPLNADSIESVIEKYYNMLLQIPEATATYKPFPSKWSIKENLGHLIDSAQNNIRRFIVSRYEERPLIVYDQREWVNASAYNDWDMQTLADLWFLLNMQVCRILRNTNDVMKYRESITDEARTIEWLTADYEKHLLHHLKEIFKDDQPKE